MNTYKIIGGPSEGSRQKRPVWAAPVASARGNLGRERSMWQEKCREIPGRAGVGAASSCSKANHRSYHL